MPEFYIIIARKIFFTFFLVGGGTCPSAPPPVSYAYVYNVKNWRTVQQEHHSVFTSVEDVRLQRPAAADADPGIPLSPSSSASNYTQHVKTNTKRKVHPTLDTMCNIDKTCTMQSINLLNMTHTLQIASYHWAAR